MSKIYFAVPVLFLSVLWFQPSEKLESYYSSSPLENDLVQPIKLVKERFLVHLKELSTSLTSLEELLIQQELQLVRNKYLETRVHFKRAEVLMAFLDHQFYERKINESPLLKPEPKVASKEVHQPRGFQVLDEQLFLEEVNFSELIKLVSELKSNIDGFSLEAQKFRLYDAQVIHAIKEQLVRSFTLGISGFDTPGSVNAIEDLKTTHQELLDLLVCYEGSFNSTDLEKIAIVLNEVKYTSFNEFDRYQYLITSLIPTLEVIEKIRVAEFIESKEELNRNPLAVNSTFTNPFQKDFLNPGFYTGIPKDQMNSDRVALGKKLFEDPLLSGNNSTACISCHNPNFAFSDQLATSINGEHVLDRNSPSLNYSVYAASYFHDLRAHDLSNQFDHVIHSEKEFNTDYVQIIDKLSTNKEYIALFSEAYKDYNPSISKPTINHALKTFLMSLSQFNSPFDELVMTQTQDIPDGIKNGFNLFMGKAQCATCHFPPTFSGLVPPHFSESESEVLGVLGNQDFDHPVLDDDLGRQRSGIVKDDYDFYLNSFKTPTIRNVSKSFPYMHNGSIETLEKVIEFYDLGGGAGMGLDLPHQTLPADQLDLTDQEKKDLVKFLESLEDGENQE